jgi:EAL domain-containing protein (putative c-di-GMP-specific phosphodiesterase class I)
MRDTLVRLFSLSRGPTRAEAAFSADPHPPLPTVTTCPDCIVIDDDEGVRTLISTIIERSGLTVEQLGDLSRVVGPIRAKLVFLDVALGSSDAIDAIRLLAGTGYRGFLQIISGKPKPLLDEIATIAGRHGLTVLPPLSKPVGAHAIRAALMKAGVTQPSGAAARVDLAEAIRENWVEVWYQPKINLRTQLLDGAEALARIRHPVHGLVMPGRFIPGASADALTALATMTIETVLRDWSDFAAERSILCLSANVPFHALEAVPIARLMEEGRPKSKAWPGLILEVTEDQAVRDIALAHEVATKLRIHDVRLSLDDFGAGYSSLARLKQFPFAEIKLDRSYVANCSRDPVNEGICRAAVNLAHTFGCTAVAEGIERPEDLRTIYHLGCDIGQGFLLGAPVPKGHFLAMVRERQSKALPAPANRALNLRDPSTEPARSAADHVMN